MVHQPVETDSFGDLVITRGDAAGTIRPVGGMPRPGPKKILRYNLDFKRKAVRLTQPPGMQVQTVANALDIHPLMLSRWRREAREGVLRGVKPSSSAKIPPLREIRRLQRLEREHALVKQEHELLKKAIRFCSEERARNSRSSSRTGRGTASAGSAASTGSVASGTTRGGGGRPVTAAEKTK